jgi:hypothetical protein
MNSEVLQNQAVQAALFLDINVKNHVNRFVNRVFPGGITRISMQAVPFFDWRLNIMKFKRLVASVVMGALFSGAAFAQVKVGVISSSTGPSPWSAFPRRIPCR